MRIRFALMAVLLSCSGAPAQRFTFGAIGGTPFSDASRSDIVSGRGGYGTWHLLTRRYTAGGMFEVRVPFGLSIEADALYKRTDTTESRFLGPSFGTITHLAANTWEFPMLINHHWHGRLRPFAGVGGTFRRLQGYDAWTESIALGFDPPYSVYRYRTDDPLTEGGIVAHAGVRLFHVGPLNVSPEFRYTRWTTLRFLPAQNQLEFLLKLTL